MKKLNALARFSVALLAICCFAITAAAQIQNGQLTGSVTDPSGAAVPNAKVTATNPNTSFTNSATTNEGGVYTVRELPIGTYKLTVEAAGFKTSAKSGIEVNAGVTYRLDFKLEVGGATEVIEVTEEAAPVNTVDSKLANTVGSTQIQNLPLNGRNVFDLILLAPGAVSGNEVINEGGFGTVVNGTRPNFQGFLINGTSNKGLSGNFNNQPIEDSVAEFQLLTLNNSAQYGNSGGSITNLVTKSGTNNYHGSAWWFVRNDVFDANSFFNNFNGLEKPPVRYNQFGGTFGGPVIKDKLFFFLTLQGARYRSSTLPSTTLVEGPEWRAAVAAAFPNSVSTLIYNNFPPSANAVGGAAFTLNEYLTGELGGLFDITTGNQVTSAAEYLCPDHYGSPFIAQQMATLLGVTAQDQIDLTASGCSVIPGLQAGSVDRDAPFLYNATNIAPARLDDTGNLKDGNEASARVDYNFGQNDRIFAQVNLAKFQDILPGSTGLRGFNNPTRVVTPNGQFNYVHTFSPTILNEFRAGYSGLRLKYVPNVPGVPSVYIIDGAGSMGFGSYNGYPQFFKEHVYTYADMLSITKGNHNIKVGADIRRNIENSDFNVARPAYYFFDPLFFATDAPYGMAAGVDPEFISGNPAHLETNIRHWRNWEFGFYFQDDWKITRNLTLNLGIRYDLYKRHTELNDLATTFLPGPGSGLLDDITTGAGGVRDANDPAGTPGTCDQPSQLLPSVLAGVCGPGGFAAASQLGGADNNNWGPRVGFAWDVFGNGKTSLRGGFGLSYEGTLYNPLSNSRWNPPYYSFNNAFNELAGLGLVGGVPYGPQTGGGCPNCATAPSFTGPADPLNFQGTGEFTAVGNIMAWNPATRHQAILTGIVLPEGIRDPYVMNWFFGIQRELMPKWVLEVNYVGTAGRKLFRAENINRIPGGTLAEGTCTVDIFGRNLCSQRDSTIGAFGFPLNQNGLLNPNYLTMRNWRNQSSSNYNALQMSLRKQMSKGFQFTFNYAWSHSIDNGSTWHSGATTANGGAGGEGFTTDWTLPGLDRGNSIFDVRHRISINYVYELPFFKGRGGVVEAVLGGWQFNGIMSYQTGVHWSPFCGSRPAGCDFNNDFVANERPNSTLAGFDGATHDMWANGWGINFRRGCQANPCEANVFTDPAPGNPGNLGRNSFVGPNFWGWDPSVFKNFKITERVGLQFRAEFFNIFNRTNFTLPGNATPRLNDIRRAAFGQAGGTFNPRNLQFGLKLTF